MRRLAGILLVIVLAACKRSSPDLNESRQMQKLPPPPEAEAPAAVSIAVAIDGQPAPAIDRAKLEATPPDFTDGDRRAWKLDTLLGAATKAPSTTFTITGDKDIAVVLHNPHGDSDAIPVLALNRRGQLLAAMVERDEPFPSYHGQGHRLERRGDPLPRVEGVKRIAVSFDSSDAH